MTVPVEIIEPIVNNQNLTWRQKFSKIVAYKRSCGLRGFHASFYCENGDEIDEEKAARSICMTELANSRGEFKDISGVVL